MYLRPCRPHDRGDHIDRPVTQAKTLRQNTDMPRYFVNQLLCVRPAIASPERHQHCRLESSSSIIDTLG
jgi:hypothetical protein